MVFKDYVEVLSKELGVEIETMEDACAFSLGSEDGEKVEILIKPFKGEGGSDDPRCTVFASFGRFDVQSYKEAIEFAKTKGGEIATEKAKAAGADTVEVSVEMKEKRFGFDDELGGEMLIETEMTVSAVGKPKEFRQKEGRLSYYVDLNQRYDMG